jgi:protein-S-isoprenylcysteine O-methyltransferase Ste14
MQWALFRAGHAHAGVWVVLSLVIQALLDSATLSPSVKWLARIAAPLAALAVSGGFFGLAYSSNFTWLLYFGAACLVLTVLLAGVGLLRRPNAPGQRGA